jgi:hypothetical protein
MSPLLQLFKSSANTGRALPVVPFSQSSFSFCGRQHNAWREGYFINIFHSATLLYFSFLPWEPLFCSPKKYLNVIFCTHHRVWVLHFRKMSKSLFCDLYSTLSTPQFNGFSCHPLKLTINVPVVYMGRYKVVLRGDYP